MAQRSSATTASTLSEAENLGGCGSTLRPRCVILSRPGFVRKGLGHARFFHWSLCFHQFILENDEVLLQIIDLVRDSSDVTSSAAARVPRAEHVDREDSAAARLVHHEIRTVFQLKWM